MNSRIILSGLLAASVGVAFVAMASPALAQARPAIVVLAAARVGGIEANRTLPADFIAENLQIELNVIDGAHRAGIQRLLFLGSSCIYPRLAPQPMQEEALLTGPLEPTNEPYAVAKIAGIKLCESYNRQHGRDYRSVMPTNLYGPGDNFHPEYSHVVAGMMRRFHEARLSGAPEVVVWGTGSPQRELVDADDLADACVFLMRNWTEGGMVNAGSSQEVSIRELSELMAEVTGYRGRIVFDTTRPDGTPRKIMDNSRLHALGWRPKTSIPDGLRKMYAWWLASGAT